MQCAPMLVCAIQGFSPHGRLRATGGRRMTIAIRTALCCIAGLLFGVAAVRAEYPERPIRLIVGFGAGGPTDIPARFIADKLGALLKQTVVVENRTGASGLLATR